MGDTHDDEPDAQFPSKDLEPLFANPPRGLGSLVGGRITRAGIGDLGIISMGPPVKFRQQLVGGNSLLPSDCGFGASAWGRKVETRVVWAKLQTMVERASLASQELCGKLAYRASLTE